MQLDAYLTKHNISGAAFGRMIGAARSTVLRYRTGERVPTWRLLGEIQRATRGDVMPNDFLKGKTNYDPRKHR